MSRRGGWNRSSYKNFNKDRPHGLRGKDIGLYYKNLQMRNGSVKKKNEDITVNIYTVFSTLLHDLKRSKYLNDKYFNLFKVANMKFILVAVIIIFFLFSR